MSVFGDELKKRRKDARMSLDMLADTSGLSKTYIADIENDKPHSVTGAPRQPSPKAVESLAMALSWDIPVALKLAFVPETPSHELRNADTGEVYLREERDGTTSVSNEEVLAEVRELKEIIKELSQQVAEQMSRK